MTINELLARRPRRIVTGQRADGTSYFARVEEVDADWRSDSVPEEQSLVEVFRMWANDRLPAAFHDRGRAPRLQPQPRRDA